MDKDKEKKVEFSHFWRLYWEQNPSWTPYILVLSAFFGGSLIILLLKWNKIDILYVDFQEKYQANTRE